MSLPVLSPARGSEVPAPLVEGVVNFAEPTAEKPYSYAYAPPAGVPPTNAVYKARTVGIHSARPFAGDLSLDVEGVAVVSHRSAVRDFWDEAQTLALGHPETAQLVKDVTGASRVVVFDHTLRRRAAGTADRTPDAPRQPATRAHVDQTVASGPQRVRDLHGRSGGGAAYGSRRDHQCLEADRPSGP